MNSCSTGFLDCSASAIVELVARHRQAGSPLLLGVQHRAQPGDAGLVDPLGGQRGRQRLEHQTRVEQIGQRGAQVFEVDDDGAGGRPGVGLADVQPPPPVGTAAHPGDLVMFDQANGLPQHRAAHPEALLTATLALPVEALIADGEAIALRPDNSPQRFQVTASRFGSSVDVEAAVAAQPLSVFFFDILHCDGVDLLDAPTTDRLAALDARVPPAQRVDRLLTADPDAAGRFLEATLAAGHEGVMAKAPGAPYQAGRRGAGWLKVKPVHTLDLVVLAVEWGSGRRRGKLSNIHLGARDPATGEFVMVGKTFKGMTDAMLDWQTAWFTELAVGGTNGYVVRVRPEQVVEVAVDGVQQSSRCPGGLALRFARVLRYRDDLGRQPVGRWRNRPDVEERYVIAPSGAVG